MINIPTYLLTTTLVLIVLKLTDQIQWPWWVVLAPFWLPLAFLIAAAWLLVLLGLFVNRGHYGK